MRVKARLLIAFAVLVVSAASETFSYAAPPCTKAAVVGAAADDRRTTKEVERRIAADESLAPLAGQVSVTTAEGVVTLRGAIMHDEERLELASLVEGIPGVRRVEDRLEIVH
jgi:osmotically-inducible protein OsmY